MFSRSLSIAAATLYTLLLASCVHQDSIRSGRSGVEAKAEVPETAAIPPDVALYPSVVLSKARPKDTASPTYWRHHAFPGKKPTQYVYQFAQNRHAVKAQAGASASMLRQAVRIEPQRLRNIRFSWKADHLIAGADLTQRETHDSPVRIVLAFEGDRSAFSMKNAMLSELAQTLTGEPLPYATLMYVWCNACAVETGFINPRTDRIREIAVNAGSSGLNQWVDHTRDIRADFEKAFGEPPGALLDVGIMTDTDNTRESVTAWYGPISLTEP